MKVTVNQIKEMIREIIKEEDSGYKAFFNSALILSLSHFWLATAYSWAA